MDQKPLNYSPLPPSIHPSHAENSHQKVPTALIIIVVFVISAGVAAGLVAVQSSRNTAAVVPTPTVAPATPTPTPADEISADDSLDTIDREVLGWQTSTSSAEATAIEKDMKGL